VLAHGPRQVSSQLKPDVSQTMRTVVLILVATLLAASATPAQETNLERQTGSICLAPVKDDGDPRGYVSDQFGVRVDDGPWVAVPADFPVLVTGVSLERKHLVSIRDGNKTIESFWFRFDGYESSNLCLWYKPWYRTWSLWDAAQGGRKCRCGDEGDRAG